MKLKLNHNYKFNNKPYVKGQIVDVEVDKNDIPLEKFWRSLLKDSRIDNCVEVIKKEKLNKKNK